ADTGTFPGSATYTVTMGANVTINKMTNTLSAGTLTFISGVGTKITFGGTAPTIDTATKLSVTTILDGSGITLTKTGAGQLQLNNNGQTIAKYVIKGGAITTANTNK